MSGIWIEAAETLTHLDTTMVISTVKVNTMLECDDHARLEVPGTRAGFHAHPSPTRLVMT